MSVQSSSAHDITSKTIKQGIRSRDNIFPQRTNGVRGKFLIGFKTHRSSHNEVDVPYVLELVHVCICFAYYFHFMHKLQKTHCRNTSVQSIAETLQRLNNALSAIGCIFATFQRKSKNDYKDDLQETHIDSDKIK